MGDSSLYALGFDPSKDTKLSTEQRRELVYEMSEWTDIAPEILQAWSRQEILQILCSELGKERKYTGLTKSKIIEQLLRIVNEKKSLDGETANASEVPTSENGERTPKRQRKSDRPNRLVTAENITSTGLLDVDLNNVIYCKNSACKAKLSGGNLFCKRCSCCICHQYDDNKDPSLWLTCCSEPPFPGISCGMSCHLECALSHKNSGTPRARKDKRLDGSFYCVSCGKVNDLLSSWRKQLVMAKETRRVDILCYRLSLCQKILAGTVQHQNLFGIVDEAVKKLEEDVGLLTGLPVKRARGIVNRLSSGPEIQRLCTLAVESLESTSPSFNTSIANLVRFEDARASSVLVILNSIDLNLENVVGYALSHRKANEKGYPVEPTCKLFAPNTRFLLSGLTPSTHYFLKVATLGIDREVGSCEFQFQTTHSQDELPYMNSNNTEIERSLSPATNCSSLSNPSTVEDETCVPCSNENRGDNYIPLFENGDKSVSANNPLDHRKKGASRVAASLLAQEHRTEKIDSSLDGDALNLRKKGSSNGHIIEETIIDNGSDKLFRTGVECVPFADSPETALPITPCKSENVKDGTARKNRLKPSGKNVNTPSTRDEEPQAGCSSKKRSGERVDGDSTGFEDKDFEYYVKAIRWLECDGHIETLFRQNFLTWYSLRATPQEMRIVKVFIDTFANDPKSLAGQLVDTFADVVTNKKCSTVPTGFCLKLWH